ncbi:mannose-1-phosphate guanylyltransferase [Lunatibacter salilacus]|uniref:mannose-1-phosphate guanylyltransferase n=1 Tax=Lunatibacter salilacus TaxID=2483804 RepID=UPI00131B847D|nr:mannose-1-phosphate guanylyltransferase [Lunatibacter salilacus]
MKNQPYIVILAGGLGIKLWPQSRFSKPKQFLDLIGTGRTLLQMTFDRFVQNYSVDRFLIVTSKRYFQLVKEQLPELKDSQIIVEPIRRNTGASLALVSYVIKKLNPDATVIVSPSDQLIVNEIAFFNAINEAIQVSESSDKLVAVGVEPHSPDTSCGYIQYLEQPGQLAMKVKTFTEKPDLELAETFVNSGDFLWNSGIFIWNNESIIKTIEKNLPELAEVFEEGTPYYGTSDESAYLKKAYSLIKSVSINYGILQKSDNVYVVLGQFGWSDLGSWQNLYDLKSKDGSKNVPEGNTLLYDTENCFVKVNPEKLVVIQGLKNYLVSDNDNVLLICKLGEEDKFREFLKDAKEKGGDYI